MSHRKEIHRHRSSKLPFLLILTGTFILYLAILLTSQSHVDGDEGVIGIMARHIITRHERPIFFYGQAYGGGAALEAYLAVIPFTLFGESSISLKLVALCMSLATLILTYLFCWRYCSHSTALVATLILAFATPLVEWHTKMRGGYAGFPLFFIVILLLYTRIAYENKANVWYYLILGLLCGLAYYNSVLILSLLVTLLFTSMSWRRTFWRWRFIGLFLLGLTIGVSPLLNYEIKHNFENTRFVFGIGSTGNKSLLLNARNLLAKYLPSFFVGRNVDLYVVNPPVQAWIEYLVYAGLIGYILYKCWVPLRKIFAAWIPGRQTKVGSTEPRPESLLVLYVFIHLVFCIISKDTATSPRYLLPLFPAFAMLAASAITKMWGEGSSLFASIGSAACVVLIFTGAFTHIDYIRPSTVNDDVLLTDGRIVNVQTTGKAIAEIVDFLHQQNISYVRSAYFIQWRILFESHETIIASSSGLVPGLNRYPEYDARVEQAPQFATVFHKDAAQLQDFSRTPASAQMFRKQIYEFVVYVPSAD